MACGGSSRCKCAGGAACYPATLTAAHSDATTAYHEYLSFTVPAGDMADGDTVEVTFGCDLTNTSGVAAFLVQELHWGGNIVSTYPSDHFTTWANGIAAVHYLYRLLFQRVQTSLGPSVWMSDLRSQWGPYSMGLGTNAPSAGTVNFNALNFGAVNFAAQQVVSLRARWTKTAGFFFNPLGAGATLAPLTARVTRFAC